ncbi:hypothetical protein CA12_09880 [Alienimonas californiensis]|uniref:DUF4935 domain-containing protein n=2 Tax=Alienimonas californiensis TaxID=2527989 RepID=A0A517P691_9PLAN|nr:hypothetical protein CA12_09880 [Alienimonas californiensis]
MLHVLLDTQPIFASGFSFKTARLLQLAAASKAGQIRIYMTAVSVDEVNHHLDDKATAAVTAGQKLAKCLRPLGTVSQIVGLELPPVDRMRSDFRRSFKDYMSSAEIERLEADGVSVSELMSMYFKRLPPFSDRKKNEFPDAVSVLTAIRWCERTGRNLHVVSGDMDWKEACERLACLKWERDLDGLLDRLPPLKLDVSAEVAHMFHSERVPIDDEVRTQFEELVFRLADYDGEIIRVTSSHFTPDRVIVVEAEENEGVGRLTIDGTIDYDASISVDMPLPLGVYGEVDSEHTGQEEIVVTRESQVTVEVSFKFRREREDIVVEPVDVDLVSCDTEIRVNE